MSESWTAPRRNRVDLWTPAEKAIGDAMAAVETTGADVRLTDAIVLLGKARERVADFVEHVNPDSCFAPQLIVRSISSAEIDELLAAPPGPLQIHDDLEQQLWTVIDRDGLADCPSDVVGAVAWLKSERERLQALIAAPELADFWKGVQVEQAHQVERWGVDHDANKTLSDWIALIVHLLGKALAASWTGDADKVKHHVITAAAALANCFRRIVAAEKARADG